MLNSWPSMVAAACMAMVVDASPARAEKCPAGDEPIFSENLQAVSDCLAAHALHEECAWGSSGDAELAETVIAKCETAFLDRLRRAQLSLYRHRGERCDTAYDQQHSIGMFQAEMCRENLAVLYFQAFSRGWSPKSPRWPGPSPAEE